MNYHKLELTQEWLKQAYPTFAKTLDTADYVPEDYNEKILKMIFKDVKKIRARLNAEDRFYQRIERIRNAPINWEAKHTAKVEAEEAKRKARNRIKAMKREIRAIIKAEREAKK